MEQPIKQPGAMPGSPAGLTPYSGDWGTPQVVHLLKRTLFGATVQDIAFFKAMTPSQAVDTLLQPTATPASKPLNNYGADPTGVAARDLKECLLLQVQQIYPGEVLVQRIICDHLQSLAKRNYQ
ncbi:MAG: hypothetical protein Q8932_12745, partial [Bacteroidota bacterium]|nr:hypothetical protein [Bacteroidota bacterium]